VPAEVAALPTFGVFRSWALVLLIGYMFVTAPVVAQLAPFQSLVLNHWFSLNHRLRPEYLRPRSTQRPWKSARPIRDSKTKIDVVYGPAEGRAAIAQRVNRSMRLLETMAEHATDEFARPMNPFQNLPKAPFAPG
jgi:hypothetical protein